MDVIIYEYKREGIGFIRACQEHIQYLCEDTGEERWLPSVKKWEGEVGVEFVVSSLDDPADISTFFPGHEGKAFFRRRNGNILHFTGTGPLNYKGIDALSPTEVSPTMKAADVVKRLGYEQIGALRNLQNNPDMEGSKLCKISDCSFMELYSLHEKGLIDIGEERILPKQLHPTLTVLGREVLEICEKRGII